MCNTNSALRSFFLVGAPRRPRRSWDDGPRYLIGVFLLLNFTSLLFGKESLFSDPALEQVSKSYTFINDFHLKSPLRSVSQELFWKYSLQPPKTQFEIKFDIGISLDEMTATPVDARWSEHMNRGRKFYVDGNYEEAKKTWLSLKARFGTEYPYHRRTDYLIGCSMLQFAKNMYQQSHKDLEAVEVRLAFSNFSTFYNQAFLQKKDLQDPLLDHVAPKALYTLASVYFAFHNLSSTYQAAKEGLDFLTRTGRTEYRSEFHRLLAEVWIGSHDYLAAAQEYDAMIREDMDPEQVSLALARMGDLYYALNNYELAEDAYTLSQKAISDLDVFTPIQSILRGESLFWLGKFSEAEKMLRFGAETFMDPRSIQSEEKKYVPWALLRLADSYLARYEAPESQEKSEKENWVEKAKLAYFQVERWDPHHEAATVAKIRGACLSLPYYQGKNISHARKFLAAIQKKSLLPEALELAASCEVASYTKEARTSTMLERVKSFASQYPHSRFLQGLAEPVREFQAMQLDTFFQKKDLYSALAFYEANQKTLFPTLSDERNTEIFRAYMDTQQWEKAGVFWTRFYEHSFTPEDALRSLVYLDYAVPIAEGPSLTGGETLAVQINQTTQNEMYLRMLINGSRLAENIAWIFLVLENWNAKEKNLCSWQLQALSRGILVPVTVGVVRKKLESSIQKNFPLLQLKDPACSSAYLSLEQQADQVDPARYAKKWLERLTWPVGKEIAQYAWQASETLFSAGDKKAAQEIWTRLGKEDYKAYPESTYAAIRLNPTRTELESLWE